MGTLVCVTGVSVRGTVELCLASAAVSSFLQGYPCVLPLPLAPHQSLSCPFSSCLRKCLVLSFSSQTYNFSGCKIGIWRGLLIAEGCVYLTCAFYHIPKLFHAFLLFLENYPSVWAWRAGRPCDRASAPSSCVSVLSPEPAHHAPPLPRPVLLVQFLLPGTLFSLSSLIPFVHLSLLSRTWLKFQFPV